MEELQKKILLDLDSAIDAKTQSIVANLFTKGGGGGGAGGVVNSRNPMAKSNLNTPTISRSFCTDEDEGGGAIGGVSTGGGPGNIYYRHSSAG